MLSLGERLHATGAEDAETETPKSCVRSMTSEFFAYMLTLHCPFSRVAHLEEQLSGIVKLLTSSQQLQQDRDQYQYPSPTNSVPTFALPNDLPAGVSNEQAPQLYQPNHQDEVALQASAPSDSNLPNEAVAAAACHTIPQSPISERVFASGIDVGAEDIDTVLQAYLDKKTEYFPFVRIKTDTTAKDLHKERPFLLRTIILISSCRSRSAQIASRKIIMEYLSVHMLVCEERSLDLLQGLLIYIAWFVLLCKHKARKLRLFQTAKSISKH